VAHDISTVSFWRRLFEVKNPINFFVHCYRWIQINIYEKYYLPLFDLVISMSNIDKNILINKYNCKNVVVKQNGIEKINFLKKKVNQTISLGYIGSFNHPPNRTAINYFITEIAPLLEKNKIKYKYFIAGDNNEEDIKTIINRSELINKKNIVNLGKVKDVEYFYKKIDILIAPIFSGSGTRIKILESLSYGIPVITSNIGQEGLNIENNFLYITNSPIEFIKYVTNVRKNLKINKGELIKIKKFLHFLLWKKIFRKYFN
jgi:glycosyltransferase involved in cell wall biosynthesis